MSGIVHEALIEYLHSEEGKRDIIDEMIHLTEHQHEHLIEMRESILA